MLWTVLWAQCSPSINTCIEALPTYESIKNQSKGLNLLVTIKNLLYNIQDQKYTSLAIPLVHWQFLLYGQGQTLSLATYYQQFNSLVDMLDHCGATIRQFLLYGQGQTLSLATYYQQFNSLVDMLDHCGATIRQDKGTIHKVLQSHGIEPEMATEEEEFFSTSDGG